MQENSKERIQPIKQHHVADFRVKSECNATKISRKTDDKSLQTQTLFTGDAPITHWPIISRPIIGAKQNNRPITD